MPAVLEASLHLDPERAIDGIVTALRHQVGTVLRRAGAVVAVSGGIDSAVCAALAVRAFGPAHVLALALPERESDGQSLALARELTAGLGIELVVEEITPILEGAGCYARRDAAIARLVEYGPGWQSKLVIDSGGTPGDHLPLAALVVRSPEGKEERLRLPPREFREIVAASNFKQRVRAMVAYHHADRLRYAVIGTPNRLEYRLGFFVKGGDGLADVKPIAHLYKQQVFQLAEALDLPAGIRARTPTTDTYSLPQTQEEFYFSIPLPVLDLLLHAHDTGVEAAAAAERYGLEPQLVVRAYAEVERMALAAEYLHHGPLLPREPSERATPLAAVRI